MGGLISTIQQFTQSRWAKLILGMVILIFFSYAIHVNWQQLQQYEWQLKPAYLGLAFLCYPINLILSMMNWHFLVRGTGGTVSFQENAEIFCYSNFPKTVPGAIWYIMGRTYMYQKKGISQTTILLASASELFFLIFAGVITSFVILPFTNNKTILLYLLLLPLLMLPLLIAPIFNKLLTLIQKRVSKGKQAQFSQRDILLILINYMLAWLWGGVILYLLINGIISLPLTILMDIILAWVISGVASLSTAFIVNGMGVKEVTLTLLLNKHMLLSVAIVVSILFKLLIMVGDMVWSGFFVILLSKTCKKTNNTNKLPV